MNFDPGLPLDRVEDLKSILDIEPNRRIAAEKVDAGHAASPEFFKGDLTKPSPRSGTPGRGLEIHVQMGGILTVDARKQRGREQTLGRGQPADIPFEGVTGIECPSKTSKDDPEV